MNFPEFPILPSLVSAIGWALIHFLWQGVLIASATAFVLMLLRNARPQLRYALSCFSLVLCLLLPLWEVLSRLNNASGATPYSETIFSSVNGGINSSQLSLVATWLHSNMNWIVMWWLVTVFLLCVRLALGLIWISGYQDDKRSSFDAQWQQRLNTLAHQFGLQRQVVLRVVHDIESPITVGFLRPMVLLPAALISGMPVPLLEALLAHELAHISRFDYVVNLVQNCIEMLLFFHPAVWWISKTIRNEREQIADDLAARILGEPRRLALALQELELFQFSTPQLAQAAHGGNLMSRIKRLLRPEVQALNWKAALSVVGLSAACLAMYAHAAVPMEEKPSVKNVKPSVSLEQKNVRKKGIPSDIVSAVINFESPGCRPEYPREALRYEQTGTVVLSVSTTANGAISKVDIDKSSNFPLLDNSVRDKLLSGTCKNKPGTLNGKTVATTTKVQYVWKLD
jgi:bla regulator protein BlaR1